MTLSQVILLSSSNEEIKQQILQRLREVMDPEIGLNVVEAGFIRNIKVEDGNAVIEMMLTTPFCPLAFFLTEAIKEKARSVEGVKTVEVKVVGFGIPPELEKRIAELRKGGST